MKRAAIAALALAGCGAANVPETAWYSMSVNGQPGLSVSNGALAMGCHEPGTMFVAARSFEVGDEATLVVELDQLSVALPAHADERSGGVIAEAAPASQILDLLTGARTVSVMYGTQHLGPTTLPKHITQSLLQACG